MKIGGGVELQNKEKMTVKIIFRRSLQQEKLLLCTEKEKKNLLTASIGWLGLWVVLGRGIKHNEWKSNCLLPLRTLLEEVMFVFACLSVCSQRKSKTSE